MPVVPEVKMCMTDSAAVSRELSSGDTKGVGLRGKALSSEKKFSARGLVDARLWSSALLRHWIILRAAISSRLNAVGAQSICGYNQP